MKISDVHRHKTALLLTTIMSVSLIISGCTSVELADKEDSLKPQKMSTVTDATSATAANAEITTTADDEALSGEVISGIAIPTAKPVLTAEETQAQNVDKAVAEIKHDIALAGNFPVTPDKPGTPSAAAIPLTEEMMQVQTILPLAKPRIPELAYASTSESTAFAALTNDTKAANPSNLNTSNLRGKEQLQELITKYAKKYDVPESLVHRVIIRESHYNPSAYNDGNYGLMQIRLGTAKGLGFKGTAKDLFNAETNLEYAVKYLRGAYLVADNNHDQAVRLYARGYYYDAKRKGLLHVLRP